MLRESRVWLLGVSLFFSSLAWGYGIEPLSGDEQYCYGKAMVGMDSVINSRLGVPPEHALDLIPKSIQTNTGADESTDFLKIILNAYLWEFSPHAYAQRVFYLCALNQGAVKSVLR